MRRFIDTNIFISYLTGGDEYQFPKSVNIIESLKTGEIEATLCEAVIAEICYVLSSRRLPYQLSPAEINKRLIPLLTLKGLKLAHKRVYLRALDIYAMEGNLDIADAMQIAHMEAEGLDEIISFDTDFDKVPHIKRLDELNAESQKIDQPEPVRR